MCITDALRKQLIRDFPGGAVVKNTSANAGGRCSTPGLGRSRMPWSNYTHAPQLLILHSRAHTPQLLKPVGLEPVHCNKRSCRNKKPTHRNEEQSPLAATRERPHAATKTQRSQK